MRQWRVIGIIILSLMMNGVAAQPKKPLSREINKIDEALTAAISQATSQNHKIRPFTIVIDAGHGGFDSGAKGKNGHEEKQVVLSIAKKLAKAINRNHNVRAVLTRDGDYFVPLRKRLNVARKGNADLFIAIHADAYFDRTAKGASVYALSPHGATNEAARWLAKRDNYSELGGVELNELQDRSQTLRAVLIDLAQTVTSKDSLHLGNAILNALDKVSSLHATQVGLAPFVVLKSPDIPSILVETGFMTNPLEASRLADPLYQQKMAQALWSGIKEYLKKMKQACHSREGGNLFC